MWERSEVGEKVGSGVSSCPGCMEVASGGRVGHQLVLLELHKGQNEWRVFISLLSPGNTLPV